MKLKTKIPLIIGAGLLVVAVILTVLVNQVFKKEIILLNKDVLVVSILNQAKLNLDDSFFNSKNKNDVFENFYRNIKTNNVVATKIWNLQGEVIYSSHKTLIGKKNITHPLFLEALKGDVVVEITHPDDWIKEGTVNLKNKTQILEMYVPIISTKGNIKGVIEVYINIDSIITVINRAIIFFDMIILIMFLLIYFLIYIILENLIIKHLEKIINGFKKVAAGQYGFKIKDLKNDEIGRVGEEFNLFSKIVFDRNKLLLDENKKLEISVKEIEKQNKSMNNTRKAILNLLEDLTEDREKLEIEKIKVIEEINNTKKFKEAVESSSEAVAITDSKAKIIFVNKAWQELTGYSPKEVIGKNSRILHSGKTKEDVYEEMWKKLAKGESFVTERITNKRKDGSEYDARLVINPVTEHGKIKFYIGLQSDISERNRIDRAKSEFISVASHQLRTPLSAMRWIVELLLDDSDELSNEQKEYLKELEASSIRLSKLVNDLLNVSRIESGRISIDPKPTNMVKLIRDVIQEFKPLTEAKNCEIEFQYKKGKKYLLKIDNILIRQVVSNLISNSLKYANKKCNIAVSIDKRQKDYLISVKDSGIGISKNDQKRIFEKFFRADNAKLTEAEGSGLGLRIAKMAVEASGGQMWFESELNKGTTFYFTLPLKGSKKKLGEVSLS